MNPLNFSNFQLSEDILKAINLLGYGKPTAVQALVIPVLLDGKDAVIKSQTGSGKTAAFAIPICQMVNWDENKPQALVITPTRELAIQVREDIFNIGRLKRLKVAAIYGKSSYYHQEKELKQKTHIVVGTPGRIIDHLQRNTLDTEKIQYLVIDEADEMLNLGFIVQLEAIIAALPKERVTVLLSATMPADIKALCKNYMIEPVYIEAEDESPAADRIRQERYSAEPEYKTKLLKDILTVENPDSCMIFCNTKQVVDTVTRDLVRAGFGCMKIHGGMEQRDRLTVMDGFKKGTFRYLTATDVAARGIDIDNVSLIINYDIPDNGEGYTHRIGRTGRLNNTGKAVSFVTPDEDLILDKIQEYTGKKIVLRETPGSEAVLSARAEFIRKTNAAPDIKADKGARLSKDIMKLHINAGRKTKMRAPDIVGAICSIEGISAGDIGIITILDVSSFVEILNNKGETVFRELQRKPVKGRLRKVSKADG